MVTIIVNGERKMVEVRTIAALLDVTDIESGTVAVAVNHSFIPTSLHGETVLKEGDNVEIVSPMQGG